MEVKTGSSAVFLRFTRGDTGICARSIVLPGAQEHLKWDIVEKIRQNERSEGEGDCRLHGEGEREKREGEGKSLTSCGNTHFSHELIQTRKVTYSIPNTQGEKESAQCVHCLKAVKGRWGAFCWRWRNASGQDTLPQRNMWKQQQQQKSLGWAESTVRTLSLNIHRNAVRWEGVVGDEPWLDAELNEPMHITPTSSLPPNAQQINSLSL